MKHFIIICIAVLFSFSPSKQDHYGKYPVIHKMDIQNYKVQKLRVINFIKEHEGFSSRQYSDGHDTAIGYGCHIKYHYSGRTIPSIITKVIADSLLRVSLERNIRYVETNFPNLHKIQQLAIAHLGYCIGIGNILKKPIADKLRSNQSIKNELCSIGGELRDFELELYGQE